MTECGGGVRMRVSEGDVMQVSLVSPRIYIPTKPSILSPGNSYHLPYYSE